MWDDRARVVEAFHAYLKTGNLRITRVEFERNLAAKARNPNFLAEVTPLLAPGIVCDASAALGLVQREFIERLPGAARKSRTQRLRRWPRSRPATKQL